MIKVIRLIDVIHSLLTRRNSSSRMISSRTILLLSSLLTVLVSTCSVIGLFSGDFYYQESINWQAQSVGQDTVDLIVVVPVLIFTTVFAMGSNKEIGRLLWGGVLLYLIYTFTIYCFAVHFNKLFLVYCLTLGIAFYAFLYLLYKSIKNKMIPVLGGRALIRLIGIYFLVISILFYLLWLSDVIPALQSDFVPVNLQESGLLTNPVHVIDLAVFLPGIFICGILLLKRRALGFLFAPVILMFFILMNITIGALVLIMKNRGIEADLSVAMGMGILALLSVALLFRYAMKVHTPDR